MSPQYREHGRRKLQPLPPSSVEHPWVLVCNEGPANQVAYLIREQENGYVFCSNGTSTGKYLRRPVCFPF